MCGSASDQAAPDAWVDIEPQFANALVRMEAGRGADRNHGWRAERFLEVRVHVLPHAIGMGSRLNI